MPIDLFEMERMQSLYWHRVEHDLSESGVAPLRIEELIAGTELDPDSLLALPLGYPLSEGSERTRERIAAWYPGAEVENVTMVNGGSEANFLALWALLEPGDRLAFMVPNYMQGWGLGSAFGRASDRVRLRGRAALLYVLFEHTVRPDRWVALKVLGYMVGVWKEQRRRRRPALDR